LRVLLSPCLILLKMARKTIDFPFSANQ